MSNNYFTHPPLRVSQHAPRGRVEFLGAPSKLKEYELLFYNEGDLQWSLAWRRLGGYMLMYRVVETVLGQPAAEFTEPGKITVRIPATASEGPRIRQTYITTVTLEARTKLLVALGLVDDQAEAEVLRDLHMLGEV